MRQKDWLLVAALAASYVTGRALWLIPSRRRATQRPAAPEAPAGSEWTSETRKTTPPGEPRARTEPPPVSEARRILSKLRSA